MITSNHPYSPDFLKDQTVLVTGGTGSLGQRFIRRVLQHSDPKKIIVFSRDEFKQHQMRQAFSSHEKHDLLRYFIGDVRDANRLDLAFREVDYIIHAAALKQVDVAEYNPLECIKTNITGAENVVRMALRQNVKGVIALSTDKACAPANIYGASKLASDKIFVASNNLAGAEGTKFSVVRYGNVIGSRGSVVPFFQKLIQDGAKALPITDPRMTRFWISLDQGVDFILSNLEIMQGGEIFIPKIPSMKITDLATAMAPDLPHEIIGIRPGEKIHEIMITEDSAGDTLELPDRYLVEPAFIPQKRGLHKKATAVVSDFSYTSNNNPDWLTPEKLVTLLK